MELINLVYDNNNWLVKDGDLKNEDYSKANIVFLFGDTDIIKDEKRYLELVQLFPTAKIVGCSSSGNVLNSQVSKYPLVATAISFESSWVEISSINFNEGDDIEKLSESLINNLPKEKLKHIFLMSDGLLINGSELTRGINKVNKFTTVTGGMAGDGARFLETYVIANNVPAKKTIVAVGFYGELLSIQSGCFAGWSEFGSQRTITKSSGNILYEIDGQPALDLYKKYLGEYASQLPNSGLRYPLNIKENDDSHEIIRTLLSINEEDKSITFAGDVPTGFKARLMKPDIDELINGAGKAAEVINKVNDKTALGLIVSCVGRKIVMNQLIDDELEIIQETLGDNVHLIGFYSYGEIAPFQDNLLTCELHNQTMTLTTIYES
ncbi:MAG: FIST C-terminal domain-containing protein [Aliarcobacter sp.]|nr:FIST C-terminal domain-containing protein [Aliarcobacter sp.]